MGREDPGPTLDADLSFAHELADLAAKTAMPYFRRELQQWAKPDGSLATEADLAVEDALRAHIVAARPADAMLGEERGQTGASSRRWIVDGIDGTVEFAAGTVGWGTLIALEVDGRVVLGVCSQPPKGRRYWAVEGHGALASTADAPSPARVHVSTVGDLASARSYIPPPRWLPDARARRIAGALSQATRPEPQTDHAVMQLVTGRYDLVVFFLAGEWDLAAPLLIVREAGGRFTDLYGGQSLTTGTAVFSNGLVHEQALEVIGASIAGAGSEDPAYSC